MTPERSAKLNELLKLQPGIIHNNRLGGGFKGDTETPEQHIPATGFPGRDWEACMTMNDTWGFKSDDHRWKSTRTLLFNLIDIASKGGNYLLNVGPTAEGIIPAPSVERLAQVGQWMKVNGESIYGTQATPFGRELGEPVKGRSGYGSEVKVSSANAWRCTRKPGKLYIHLFEWPQGSFILDQVDVNLKKAYLLADPAKNPLPSTYQDNRLSITLPEKAPDAIASVLVLEIDGEATQKP
jgi:alpha-L-fucosidase